MKYLIIILIVLILGLVIFYSITFKNKISLSNSLIKTAVPFEQKGDFNKHPILVLGDSTGVGVGAELPKDSVAGRLYEKTNSEYLENYSVSGALVEDLDSQINKIEKEKYSTILIQVGEII